MAGASVGRAAVPAARPATGGVPSGGINARAADPGRPRPSASSASTGWSGPWSDDGAPAGRQAAGRLEAVGQRLDGRRRDLTPLEVLAAPGAQRPVEADQARAVRADPIEAGPAGRADDPFLVDPPLAGRAVADRLDLGEEGLLGQVALPDLADLLVGPDDLVDPHGEDEEDRGEQDDPGRHEVRQDRVVRALLHVAERPVGGGDPQDDRGRRRSSGARTGRSGCRRCRRSCRRSRRGSGPCAGGCLRSDVARRRGPVTRSGSASAGV